MAYDAVLLHADLNISNIQEGTPAIADIFISWRELLPQTVPITLAFFKIQPSIAEEHDN